MREMFTQYDKDNDDQLSLQEFECLFCLVMGDGECPDCADEDEDSDVCPAEAAAVFGEHDADHNERLDRTEFAGIYDVYG